MNESGNSTPEPVPPPLPAAPLPAQAPAPPNTAFQPRRPAALGGLALDDLITLNEEIAGMARAGLPLDQGLAALAKEMAWGRLQRVTAAIAEDLKAGRTLPEAIERQHGRVPAYYSGLVAAGIRSGRLGEVLATMTAYSRTLFALWATVVNALVYPVLVMVLATALFTVVGLWVVPSFEDIFKSFRLRLPWITEVTLAIARRPLQLFILPMVGIAVWLVAMKLTLSATVWARFVYAIPLVGPLIRSARLAAVTDLLGILVDHQVPLPEAFRLAGQASSDPLMAEGARQVVADLQEGVPLGQIMRRRRLVPEVIAWMTGLGEQRGNLGTTLHQVAEVYRRQVEMRAALLRNVLPPFLILFVAVVMVALMVFALFLPLISLLGGLSGGKLF